jgi:D-alanyl-D-alanine carboxypeptidase (penicillin-binding protein 5/6)
VLAVLSLSLLAGPAVARASVLDADYVGDRQVGKNPGMREQMPDLYIPSGMLVTADGRELWARDPRQRRAMASTTKIMTAVVVLERAKLDDRVTVTRNAATKVGESAMNVQSGESLTVRQLLEGLMVQSGNDAAFALAEHVGGSMPGFVKLMNDKARALGLENTRFRNPHGLDQSGHYTSAADLTALTRYAMKDPVFRRVVSTNRTKVVTSRYTHTLTSKNALLKSYRGAIGVKTGFTDDAGYCIVGAAKRRDVELVATVLGAASEGGRLQQVKRLLDWGFKHYRPVTVIESGEPLGRVTVSDWLDRTVAAESAATTQTPVFDLAGDVRREVKLVSEIGAPVARGQRLGTVNVYQGRELLAQVPVVAAADVEAPTFFQRVGIFFTRIWRGIFGG